jgi:hypothetical protein
MDRLPGLSIAGDSPAKFTVTVYAFLAVVTGGLLYLFFRPAPPVFLYWFGYFGLGEFVAAVRTHTLEITPLLPGWAVYSLPQGLWAFAYALIIAGVWGKQRSAHACFWLATIPLLAVGFEVLQYTGVIRGTFCITDTALGLCCSIPGAILGIKTGKNHSNKVNGWLEARNA